MLKTIDKLIVFLLITACSGPGNSGKQRAAPDEAGPASVQRAGQAESNRGELPETSVYRLQGEWHSQEGDTIGLESLRGKIPVLAMVFTHCEFACPRIVSDMKNIQKKLPAGKADEVVFVLVSFDTERDRPERLKAYAKEASLGADWLLLHGNEDDVRMLSMLLDVNYQKQAGGTFAHANIITLLNRDGQIVSQVEGLGADAGAIISEMSKL